jgi:hypothetical protein
MNFAFFLLLNAVLLLRPEEVVPSLAGLRLYFIAVGFCILTSFGRLMELLSPSSLRDRPVAVCVLIFYLSTILSNLALGRASEAFIGFGSEFFKVVLFYFLLLANVDTEWRFRTYVATLIALVTLLTSIALAQHHGTIDIEGFKFCLQRETDPVTGEEFFLKRLVATGIFNDPNDLCLILGLGILSCIYLFSTSPESGFLRFLWLPPVLLFAYAVIETHSRGGLLGIMAGLSAYLFSRYGGTKSIPLALGGGFLLMIAIGGRSTNIEGGGTAHQRVMIWSDGITTLLSHPHMILTGMGIGWFHDDQGLVAHNSFVQAIVELGIIGGSSFLGAFLLAGWLCHQIGRAWDAPEWTIAGRPYVFGVLVGYAVGCYSVTRNFVIPTYLVLGLISVVIDHSIPVLPEKYRVNLRWFFLLFAFGFAGLLFLRLATMALILSGV